MYCNKLLVIVHPVYLIVSQVYNKNDCTKFGQMMLDNNDSKVLF